MSDEAEYSPEIKGRYIAGDFEYAMTTGPRKAFDPNVPPDDDPTWEEDFSRGEPGYAWKQFEYHEEAYWKRRVQNYPPAQHLDPMKNEWEKTITSGPVDKFDKTRPPFGDISWQPDDSNGPTSIEFADHIESYWKRPILKDDVENNPLVKHANRELEIIGEEPWAVQGYLDMVKIFVKMGHSGASAGIFTATLNRLLQFKNLAPLTDNPDEWHYHGKDMWDGEKGVWQNIRNSEAFSTDGGKTYTLLSENADGSPLHTSVDNKLLKDGKLPEEKE